MLWHLLPFIAGIIFLLSCCVLILFGCLLFFNTLPSNNGWIAINEEIILLWYFFNIKKYSAWITYWYSCLWFISLFVKVSLHKSISVPTFILGIMFYVFKKATDVHHYWWMFYCQLLLHASFYFVELHVFLRWL